MESPIPKLAVEYRLPEALEACFNFGLGKFRNLLWFGIPHRVRTPQYPKHLYPEPDHANGICRGSNVVEAYTCELGCVLWESLRICIFLLSGPGRYIYSTVEYISQHLPADICRVRYRPESRYTLHYSGTGAELSINPTLTSLPFPWPIGSISSPEARCSCDCCPNTLAKPVGLTMVWS